MPDKPENTSVSDEAWKIFKEYADNNGISLESTDDWYPWFELFELGYISRRQESLSL